MPGLPAITQENGFFRVIYQIVETRRDGDVMAVADFIPVRDIVLARMLRRF